MLRDFCNDLKHRRLEGIRRIAGHPFDAAKETHFTMAFLKTR